MELGSFRVFGARHAVPVLGLGSFRIIRPDGSGEIRNPNLEILDTLDKLGAGKPEIRNGWLET